MASHPSTPSHYTKDILEVPQLEYETLIKVPRVFSGAQVCSKGFKGAFEVEPSSSEAYRLKSTNRIQSTRVLGSRETTRLTTTQHLGFDFIEEEETCDEPAEFYFIEGGRKSSISRRKASKANNVTWGSGLRSCNRRTMMH